MDKKDELIKNPQSLADQFLDLNEVEIRSFFEKHIRDKYTESPHRVEEELTETLLENTEKEIKFVRSLIESYEKWSHEPEPIVLWDVDDTMGKYDFDLNPRKWIFRPSLISLMNFLNENFPNVKNGIMSNRGSIGIQLDSEPLNKISFFFDRNHLYTSRDVNITREAQSSLTAEIRAAGDFPNMDHLQKLKLFRELKSKDLNVKIIDDNSVAKSFGVDGLCVWENNLSF